MTQIASIVRFLFTLSMGLCAVLVSLSLLTGCSTQVHVSSSSDTPSVSSSSTSASEELSLYEDGVVLVLFPSGTSLEEIHAFLDEGQLVSLDEIDEQTISYGLPFRCSIPEGSSVEETVERLSSNTQNVAVQPNYLYQLTTEDIDAAVQSYISTSTSSN